MCSSIFQNTLDRFADRILIFGIIKTDCFFTGYNFQFLWFFLFMEVFSYLMCIYGKIEGYEKILKILYFNGTSLPYSCIRCFSLIVFFRTEPLEFVWEVRINLHNTILTTHMCHLFNISILHYSFRIFVKPLFAPEQLRVWYFRWSYVGPWIMGRQLDIY